MCGFGVQINGVVESALTLRNYRRYTSKSATSLVIVEQRSVKKWRLIRALLKVEATLDCKNDVLIPTHGCGCVNIG